MEVVTLPSESPAQRPFSPLVAQRYQPLAELGGGGMAHVYAVLDTTNGQRVALKRLSAQGRPEHRRRVAELFAREFQALSQLAHPSIVEVYDYGVDAEGPYYTMEILDGGDLQQWVPVEYRRLCAIARDVCSALSLLHARRIVHRDISPRNIRCTVAGAAKLIDFGAMAPMGPSKELVGTPAFCAPEVLNLQALDARTDLYALGAALYYALTAHHPYPARDFSSLHNLWQYALVRPSELVPEVPAALDDLVLDLLQLDMNDRPNNAAEVFERLRAIEGRAVNDQSIEQHVAAQSYLATPSFVGRNEELARVRARIALAKTARGSVVLVRGEKGSGRSRFLEVCLLDAQLQGCIGLRADADDAAPGDYGVLRRLLSQLQQRLPELACELMRPDLPVLGHIMPELLVNAPVTLAEFAHPNHLRTALQDATQRVLLGTAAHAPLLIAIDDIYACDEPSVAALALFSRNIERTSIVLIASMVFAEPEQHGATLKLMAAHAHDVAIPSLTESESLELLCSIFGASPALAPLTKRLHSLSAGSPRDLMRLAQSLVDRQLARYAAGSWSLPAQLGVNDLPESIAQLMRDRIVSVSAAARQLVRALALCPELTFTVDEAAQLGAYTSVNELAQDLTQLTTLDIVRLRADGLILTDRAWIAPLLAELPEATLKGLHLLLASAFDRRGDHVLRRAQHLLLGGDTQRALDVFTEHAIESRKQTDNSIDAFHRFITTLPEQWYQAYDAALRACDEHGRPKRDWFAIAARFGTITATKGIVDHVHMPVWLARLKAASCLEDYERLDATLAPDLRVRLALEAATARFEQLSDRERGLDPRSAIQHLASACRFVIATAAPALDLVLLRTLPSFQPLVGLAPALQIVESLRVGLLARVSGRINLAANTYVQVLERLSAPDGCGLEAAHVTYSKLTVGSALAVLEAGLGLASCLARAQNIEQDVLMRGNAAAIRLVYALWQGDSRGTERERKHREELRIQSGTQTADPAHLVWQVAAYAAMEDLTSLKHCLAEIAPLSAAHAGWRSVEVFGKSEYERIRGDCSSANTLLGAFLQNASAGEHFMWAQLAAAQIRALSDAGRVEHAVEFGKKALRELRAAELGQAAERWVVVALSVAQAKLGEADAAVELDAVVAQTIESGSTGLLLGVVYEARAYVALFQDDTERYQHFEALCQQELTRHKNPALSAKLQRLKREAQRRQLGPVQQVLQRATGMSVGWTVLKSRLRQCSKIEERAELMLRLLAQRSGASQGFLFQVTPNGPSCVATIGDPEPDPQLQAMVEELIAAETRPRDPATDEPPAIERTQWTGLGDSKYRRVVLSHYNVSGCCITGVGVFVVKPGQAFQYPGETAAQISQMAHEIGDASALIVEEDD